MKEMIRERTVMWMGVKSNSFRDTVKLELGVLEWSWFASRQGCAGVIVVVLDRLGTNKRSFFSNYLFAPQLQTRHGYVPR